MAAIKRRRVLVEEEDAEEDSNKKAEIQSGKTKRPRRTVNSTKQKKILQEQKLKEDLELQEWLKSCRRLKRPENNIRMPSRKGSKSREGEKQDTGATKSRQTQTEKKEETVNKDTTTRKAEKNIPLIDLTEDEEEVKNEEKKSEEKEEMIVLSGSSKTEVRVSVDLEVLQEEAASSDTETESDNDDKENIDGLWGLKKSMYVCGRAKDAVDIFLSQPTDRAPSYSRRHFQLTYDENLSMSWIKDISTGGTYLNEELLVRGRDHLLCSDDVIALVTPKNPVFLFVNAEKRTKFPKQVLRRYDFVKEIGRGYCGDVHSFIRIKDEQLVAIKTINFEELFAMEDYVKLEINILRKVNHLNIISLIDVVREGKVTSIVMEMAHGGDMTDRMEPGDPLDESLCKLYSVQILIAVRYLHSRGIVHRDLKPSNVLMATEDKVTLAKVGDFGLSKMLARKGTRMQTALGTPCFCAPEIMRSSGQTFPQCYTDAVDLWAIGVLLFRTLSGSFPFNPDLPAGKLRKNIMDGACNYREQEWDTISHHGIDLTNGLLDRNVETRLTADEALSTPWFLDDNQLLKDLTSLGTDIGTEFTRRVSPEIIDFMKHKLEGTGAFGRKRMIPKTL